MMTKAGDVMPDRIDQLARDLENHAKTISVMVTDQREMKDQLVEIDKEEAVRAERDKHLDERLTRIETSIRGVYGLGRWILAAIGSVLLAIIVNFVVRGGLFLGQ